MLGSHLRLAGKVLLRRKFFTAVSLFGISFTLVVLMVAVAILDHILAPMPPETRQERTLGVYFAWMRGKGWGWNSEPGFLLLDRYGRGLPGVERMSIFSTPQDVPSYLAGKRITSALKRTDGEFWKILDFTFLEGSPFTTQDVDEGQRVAVINDSTRRRFFGDVPALGRTLEADGQRFRVVGVVPDVPRLREVPFADIWVPVTTAKSDSYRRELMGNFMGIFLARSPADFPAIKEEFRARMKRVEFTDPHYTSMVAVPETTAERIASMVEIGPARGFLGTNPEGETHIARFWTALGVMAVLFMLLPTMNLVNLNVSRIMERASEIGVRKAFGATSGALVRQFVVENVALTLLGGAIGFVLAAAVLSALTASGLVAYAHFQMNGRVFLWGLGLALLFGVVSGAYPAWRMSRLHPVAALAGGGR
jgi:putative ABC transport system permease protein